MGWRLEPGPSLGLRVQNEADYMVWVGGIIAVCLQIKESSCRSPQGYIKTLALPLLLSTNRLTKGYHDEQRAWWQNVLIAGSVFLFFFFQEDLLWVSHSYASDRVESHCLIIYWWSTTNLRVKDYMQVLKAFEDTVTMKMPLCVIVRN